MGVVEGFSNSLSLVKDTLNLTAKNPVLLESTKYALAFTLGYVALMVLALALGLFFFPFLFLFFLLVIASIFYMPFVGNFFASAHTFIVYKVAKVEKPVFG